VTNYISFIVYVSVDQKTQIQWCLVKFYLVQLTLHCVRVGDSNLDELWLQRVKKV
jgi:hypothetical protein